MISPLLIFCFSVYLAQICSLQIFYHLNIIFLLQSCVYLQKNWVNVWLIYINFLVKNILIKNQKVSTRQVISHWLYIELCILFSYKSVYEKIRLCLFIVNIKKYIDCARYLQESWTALKKSPNKNPTLIMRGYTKSTLTMRTPSARQASHLLISRKREIYGENRTRRWIRKKNLTSTEGKSEISTIFLSTNVIFPSIHRLINKKK